MTNNNNVKQHSWGYEIIWAKTQDYQGKILVLEKKHCKIPLHFTKTKTRSWFVNHGSVKISYIDTVTGETNENTLTEGQTFHIIPLNPIQAECLLENTSITEVGTGEDKDLYLLEQDL